MVELAGPFLSWKMRDIASNRRVHARRKNGAGPRSGPAPKSSIGFPNASERLTQCVAIKLFTGEGVPRLWEPPSQDAGQAARELSLPDEAHSALEVRLQRGVQSVGEAPAAHEQSALTHWADEPH